jgi:membrane protein
LAGSIAFFAFFSLIPSLLLLVALGSLVGGEQFATRIVRLFETSLSAEGSAVIAEALADPTGQLSASIVGVVGLCWSALKVFRTIDLAFDRIYGTDALTTLPQQLRSATVVVVSIGGGIILILIVQMTLIWLDTGLSPYVSLIGVPVLLGGLLILLAPLYYVMPPVRIPARQIVPGTITAVVGLTVLQQLFHVYASLAGQYRAYGFIGAVLLFLLWLYVAALVLLLGAVVNVVTAR